MKKSILALAILAASSSSFAAKTYTEIASKKVVSLSCTHDLTYSYGAPVSFAMVMNKASLGSTSHTYTYGGGYLAIKPTGLMVSKRITYFLSITNSMLDYSNVGKLTSASAPYRSYPSGMTFVTDDNFGVYRTTSGTVAYSSTHSTKANPAVYKVPAVYAGEYDIVKFSGVDYGTSVRGTLTILKTSSSHLYGYSFKDTFKLDCSGK